MANWGLWIIFGYVLGAIPFGLVLTRLAGYGDIRAIGSGNIGATNVLRTGNRLLALGTLVLDSGKGAIAVAAASIMADSSAGLCAGAAAMAGHCFPVWLGFKGGKGVATTFGTLFMAIPSVGVAAGVIWLIVMLIFRISSLSAVVAMAGIPIFACLLPTYSWFGHKPDLTVTAVSSFLITAVVIHRHTDNIRRLLNGEEPRIGVSE